MIRKHSNTQVYSYVLFLTIKMHGGNNLTYNKLYISLREYLQNGYYVL